MKLTILFVQFARACGCVNFTVFCILLGCNLDHHISQAAWAAQTVWKHQEILQFTAAIRSWSDMVRPSTVLWRKYVQQHWCSRYKCFLFSYIMLHIYIYTYCLIYIVRTHWYMCYGWHPLYHWRGTPGLMLPVEIYSNLAAALQKTLQDGAPSGIFYWFTPRL